MSYTTDYSDTFTVGHFKTSDFTDDFILDIDRSRLFKILPRFTDYFCKTFQLTPNYTSRVDQLFSVIIPVFKMYKNQLLQVYAYWRLPTDQLFQVYVNVPDPYYISGQIMDLRIILLRLIKNSWSLTDTGLTASDITFSTGWYSDNISMPQIVITSNVANRSVLTCGDSPLYFYGQRANIDIWVRPTSDSGQSLGSAKNAEYKIRREVERILRSGSRVGTQYNNEEFIYLGRRRLLDELNRRPPLLRSRLEIIDNKFRTTYEEDV